MKLKQFVATKVHGFLPYDFAFNDSLTFLTGINGSGKTTALNIIIALITPNLVGLQSVEFEKVTIFFVDDKNKLEFVSATKHGSTVTMNCSGIEDSFYYNSYMGDPNLSLIRRADFESAHYRELLSNNAANAVLKFIASLPTPMFLGLDRRARLEEDDRSRMYAARPRNIAERSVISASTSGSLKDATELAEGAYREARFASYRVSEELQRQMLLNLLTFSNEDFNTFTTPTSQDIRDLERVSADLETLPAIFNLPRNEIQRRVAPFVQELQQIVERIPRDFSIEEVLKHTVGEPKPVIQDVIKWSSNKSQLKRIKVISQTVSTYNERREDVMKPIEKYKGLVNKFLNDSGKSIEIDDHGDLFVLINGIREKKPVSSLSSGEAQIFVILTQLSFNKSAHRANIFIIDEPELSLHVYWQELFVDSIISANDRIQFVLATHSPSIILGRVKSCVDISRKSKVAAKRG